MTQHTAAKTLHHRVAHLGSTQVHAWMFPYVLGYRDRVPFLNAEETVRAIQKALLFVQLVHAQKGTMLLVNTHPSFASLVKKTATLMHQPYVNEYWIGGLLTNWQQLKYSIHAYKKFTTFMTDVMHDESIAFPKYAKAHKRFTGVQNMHTMPDVLILFQATTTYKHIVEEAKRLHIPVITCMDTYAPNIQVAYPIPVNVHSKAFFHFFCRLLVKSTAQPAAHAKKRHRKKASAHTRNHARMASVLE